MGTAKILVVDDDRDLVEVIRITLESGGYQVLVAYNAREGLALVQAERPDLVLLDVMMPDGTEGFHFVWNLRQWDDPYLAETPIVILSAIHEKTSLRFYPDSGDGTYQAGEFLPVQDFADKPLSPDQLLAVVGRVLTTSGRG